MTLLLHRRRPQQGKGLSINILGSENAPKTPLECDNTASESVTLPVSMVWFDWDHLKCAMKLNSLVTRGLWIT